MKPTHKGIAFNAVDAANNLNGTKTRHLIRVSNAVYRKALFGFIAHSDCHEDTTITKQQYITEYLNAHAPYKPVEVVYQKEKVYQGGDWHVLPLKETPIWVNVFMDNGTFYFDGDNIASIEHKVIPRTQMPIKYARCWLQIASCTAVQVDGVWMWETIYSKTEKPIGI